MEEGFYADYPEVEMAVESPNDRQVAGSHYQASYQHWDLVADNHLPYFPAQITRYVTRWQKKNGVQDVEKAQHYLEKLMSLHNPRHGSHIISFPIPRQASGVAKFIKENKLGNLEFLIFQILFTYTTISELDAVAVLLEELRIKAVDAAEVKF